MPSAVLFLDPIAYLWYGKANLHSEQIIQYCSSKILDLLTIPFLKALHMTGTAYSGIMVLPLLPAAVPNTAASLPIPRTSPKPIFSVEKDSQCAHSNTKVLA